MGFTAYRQEAFTPAETEARATVFWNWMQGRRTVREFDPTRDVSRAAMEQILEVAGSAPSGAHKQPWTYVAIRSADLKQKIRDATEAQEKEFYESKITAEWKSDLDPLGTDFEKTHLTDAPWIVVVFAQDYAVDSDGAKHKHYYVNESVGISVGFFLAAVRQAGLVSLTHTPSPMNYLRDLLGRPKNEHTYLVLPVGYAAEDCMVPDLARKSLDEFVIWK
jgi:iodotyrosine deiodinase